MATIVKDISIKARPEAVWAAIRQVGNVHEGLARGFVTNTGMDGEDRIVTFANGFIVRERIVSLDDATRRLAYSAVGGQLTHHNASFQVFADGESGTRLLWTTDLLPHEAAGEIGVMIQAGVDAMRRTLEEDAA